MPYIRTQRHKITVKGYESCWGSRPSSNWLAGYQIWNRRTSLERERVAMDIEKKKKGVNRSQGHGCLLVSWQAHLPWTGLHHTLSWLSDVFQILCTPNFVNISTHDSWLFLKINICCPTCIIFHFWIGIIRISLWGTNLFLMCWKITTSHTCGCEGQTLNFGKLTVWTLTTSMKSSRTWQPAFPLEGAIHPLPCTNTFCFNFRHEIRSNLGLYTYGLLWLLCLFNNS